jgi:hypothetical protein
VGQVDYSGAIELGELRARLETIWSIVSDLRVESKTSVPWSEKRKRRNKLFLGARMLPPNRILLQFSRSTHVGHMPTGNLLSSKEREDR